MAIDDLKTMVATMVTRAHNDQVALTAATAALEAEKNAHASTAAALADMNNTLVALTNQLKTVAEA